ncbi:MAG: thioredoxin-dependent thiol peroxidase [Chlorobi bacterium]|nr:thioredoxin-dependent thiol peroxidase [Chlorobiota bacterium]
MTLLAVGSKAPALAGKDQYGKPVSLQEYRGKKVVLYFYPKDDTPGCTKEACAFRDNFPNFQKIDAEVLGVSIDSAAKHTKFAEKYQLPFRLLADEEKSAVEAYGVWGKKKFMGKEYMGTNRVTYLIDAEGVIEKVWPKVTPASHAEEILNYLGEKT